MCTSKKKWIGYIWRAIDEDQINWEIVRKKERADLDQNGSKNQIMSKKCKRLTKRQHNMKNVVQTTIIK